VNDGFAVDRAGAQDGCRPKISMKTERVPSWVRHTPCLLALRWHLINRPGCTRDRSSWSNLRQMVEKV